MLGVMGKKIFTIYAQKVCLTGPMHEISHSETKRMRMFTIYFEITGGNLQMSRDM